MHVLKHACEKEEVQSQLALKWPRLALNTRGAKVVGIGKSKLRSLYGSKLSTPSSLGAACRRPPSTATSSRTRGTTYPGSIVVRQRQMLRDPAPHQRQGQIVSQRQGAVRDTHVRPLHLPPPRFRVPRSQKLAGSSAGHKTRESCCPCRTDPMLGEAIQR